MIQWTILNNPDMDDEIRNLQQRIRELENELESLNYHERSAVFYDRFIDKVKTISLYVYSNGRKLISADPTIEDKILWELNNYIPNARNKNYRKYGEENVNYIPKGFYKMECVVDKEGCVTMSFTPVEQIVSYTEITNA